MLPDVDIRDNVRFERAWYEAEKICFVGMGLVVLAGLLGLLGSSGPLNRTSASAAGAPVRASYQRFVTKGTASRIEIDVDRPLPGALLSVRLDRALLRAEDVTRISPRPVGERATADGIAYLVDLGPDRRGTVTFATEPRRYGRVRGTVVAGGAALPVTQFIHL